MTSAHSLCFSVLILLATTLAPSAVHACSDAGGPGNFCNDGGPAWIACSAHTDCPAGQVCGPSGGCICGDSCIGDTQQCTDAGCHCCAHAGSGCGYLFM